MRSPKKSGERSPVTSGAVRSDVAAFLTTAAKVPALRGKSADAVGKLIFALDATASRRPTWDRASHLQAEMFQAADGVGGLAIQLAYYRGFREFSASGWTLDADTLLKRMSRVDVRAGQTQIGRVLRHALSEQKAARAAGGKVNALVFIGDALEEDVDRLGELAGQLGLAGLPAFVFQEGRDRPTELCYREIARLSGGAYARFDSGAADQLRDLLTAVAVYAAGGRQALLARGQGTRGGEVAALIAQLK